jgi:hypothetical protein
MHIFMLLRQLGNIQLETSKCLSCHSSQLPLV